MSSSQEAIKAPSLNPSPPKEDGRKRRKESFHPRGEVWKGLWFLTLFAAEEIPAAMVTYVALLMLIQLGLAPAEATFYSALLFIPWVLKSFIRPWVKRTGNLRLMLHIIEALLFFALLILAFSFQQEPIAVFLALMLVSLLCAWHELIARMYYEQTLPPIYQRLFTVPKLACSQIAIIFTYGALIFLVGTLQVYFRQIHYSWSLGCYVTAGIFLLFAILHMWRLSDSPLKEERIDSSPLQERRIGSWGCVRPILLLFFLLLPQALMFHARVLYLFTSNEGGGLQCTMQEIGFAQGTVGVIAFSVGIAWGRLLIKRLTLPRLFWPMALSIVLSPIVYLGMTFWPPQSLWQLCCCTLSAQLLFGFGLGACRLPLSTISGNRYRNTINMLQIPLVSAAMIVPMAISGWLAEHLGFSTYFLVNALSAPICLLGVYLLRCREIPPAL